MPYCISCTLTHTLIDPVQMRLKIHILKFIVLIWLLWCRKTYSIVSDRIRYYSCFACSDCCSNNFKMKNIFWKEFHLVIRIAHCLINILRIFDLYRLLCGRWIDGCNFFLIIFWLFIILKDFFLVCSIVLYQKQLVLS